MGILGTIEKLETVIETEEGGSDDAFLKARLDLAESDDEIRTDEDVVMEDEIVADEVEEATEHLNAVSKVVRKYGLSKPIMRAADPNGELTQLGIVKSYEELEETPEEGAESDQVADELQARLKSTYSKMRTLYKRMSTSLKSWRSKLKHRSMKAKMALRLAITRMEDDAVPEEVPEEVETPAVEFFRFEQLAKSTAHLLKTLSTEEPGGETELEEPVNDIPAVESGPIGKKQWSKSNILKALKMSEEVEQEVEAADEPMAKMIARLEDEAAAADDAIQAEPGDEAEVTNKKMALRRTLRYQKLSRQALRQARFLTNMSLRMAFKVSKAKKKKAKK